MRYSLIGYQRAAAIEVLKRIRRARRDWADDRSLSAFALSAVTGAGKTVIATAVIEALIHGSADLDTEPDPRALFLWVTDNPALNRQTRNKMIAGSGVLASSRLVVLDDHFVDSKLRPGHVYFLNVQKLSKNAGFARGGNNKRQHSGWDIIRNTVESRDRDLYVVLDEAHRGMKRSADRTTIVQRILGGQPGSNPPAPIVWGISATIDRFTSAMAANADVRTTYSAVTVPIDKVRDSGIVKDTIHLDEPDETGTFSTTLLRAAVDTTLDFQKRWADYSAAENEPLVLPALIIQVPDKASKTALTELVSVVEEDWPDLGPHSVVNVFGEHSDLVLGKRTVRWVRPESIQDETDIRVVLAKEAISTGWDCPRAEVLYSERPAKDATHIAQVIGRMVRSPLARRISTDDELNSVSCFLPRFNRDALQAVTDELTKPGEVGSASEVVIHARLFERNELLSPEVFAFVEDLPSWPKPDALANPLRRAKTLMKLLTDDVGGTALLPDAGERLTRALNMKLDGIAAENADSVAENVEDLQTAKIHRTSVTHTGETIATESRLMRTAARDIDQDTRRRVASIKEGVAKDYLKYRVGLTGEEPDVLAIRTQVAGLLMLDGIVPKIEQTATKWVRNQFSRFAVEIKNSTGATKDAFIKVREQTSEQEETVVELTTNLKAGTKTSTSPEAKDLPLFEGHLFAGKDGMFPAKLNDWETRVIQTEIVRPSFVAWYRNPQRAGTSSFRIGYMKDNDDWGSLQVDFIVISQRTDGTLAASIVDPHGDHLADAKAKLRGLATFAELFGDQFVRIESIAEVSSGSLKSLDLLDESVRGAIRGFEGGKVTALYESVHSSHYE